MPTDHVYAADFTANAGESLVRAGVVLAVRAVIWGMAGAARALRLRVKEVLDAEGVEIPFPQRTVWLRTEPETLAAPIPVATNGLGDGRVGSDG